MSIDSLAERNLRAGLQAGVTASFEELLNTYEQAVYTLCSLITRSESECERAVCKLLRRIIAEAPKIPDNMELRLWMLRAAVECAMSENETAIEQLDVSIEAVRVRLVNESDGSEPEQSKGALRFAVRLLPTEYRAVFVLREVLRLSFVEIAILASVSEIEARAYFHRARRMLTCQMRKPIPNERAASPTSSTLVLDTGEGNPFDGAKGYIM